MKFHHGCSQCRSGPTLGSPQNVFRHPLLVVSKKIFDVMAHPEAEWPSQKSVLIFFFFHYFLVPLADKIPAEPLPENLKLVGFMFAQGG